MATRIGLELWNRWVPVRKETAADGTTSLYFGIGRLWWRRPPKPYHPDTWATVPMSDEEFDAFLEATESSDCGPGCTLHRTCRESETSLLDLALEAIVLAESLDQAQGIAHAALHREEYHGAD